MLKESSSRTKKVLTILLIALFAVSVLAVTVSAQNVTMSTENGNGIANGNSKEIAMKKVIDMKTDDGKDIAIGKIEAMETNDGKVGMGKIVGIKINNGTVISIN